MATTNLTKVYVSLLLIVIQLSGCSGCSKSGLRGKSPTGDYSNGHTIGRSKEKNIVKMEIINGVRHVSVEINELKLKFVFDTGASSICISAAEATVLYRQGTLKKEDIIDVQYFQDATGRVSAGTRINLRTVKIGTTVLRNIEALVIDNNEAPLLLGQSALEKFGKISIDNNNNIITFE